MRSSPIHIAMQSLLLLTAYLMLVGSASATTCVDTPVAVKTVKGVVLDPAGVAMPDIEVRLESGDKVRLVKTDKHGRFSFTSVRNGIHKLHAESLGFAKLATSVKVVQSSPNRLLIVHLRLGGSCSYAEAKA